MDHKTEKKCHETWCRISMESSEQQIQDLLKDIKESIGIDRNKLLLAKTEIKASKECCNIPEQISIIVITISVISLFISALPNDLFFYIPKIVYAIIAGIFAVCGLIYIIRLMRSRKAYLWLQVALEEYEQQLQNGK